MFVLRDRKGEAIGDIGLRISSKTRMKPMSDMPSSRKLRVRDMPVKRRAICDYGFSQLGVNAINARVLGDNIGSARLLEKHGFVRIQVLEKPTT